VSPFYEAVSIRPGVAAGLDHFETFADEVQRVTENAGTRRTASDFTVSLQYPIIS
jgi:hypothetical protein